MYPPFAPYELRRKTATIKVGHWCYIRKLVECAKKDKMFNLVIHGIFGFLYLSNSQKSVLIIYRFYSSYKYQNPYNAVNIGRFFVP